MKDSQQGEYLKNPDIKYIKANNERFSTDKGVRKEEE